MPAKKKKEKRGKRAEEHTTVPSSIVADPALPGRLITDSLKMLLPVARKIEERLKGMNLKATLTKLGQWIVTHMKDVQMDVSLKSLSSSTLLLAAITSQVDDATAKWGNVPDDDGIDLTWPWTDSLTGEKKFTNKDLSLELNSVLFNLGAVINNMGTHTPIEGDNIKTIS